MNQKSSLRKILQFVSQALTANSQRPPKARLAFCFVDMLIVILVLIVIMELVRIVMVESRACTEAIFAFNEEVVRRRGVAPAVAAARMMQVGLYFVLSDLH